MHVLMLAQIGRDLAHFRVELDINVLFLAKHDGVLQVEVEQDDHLAVARLEEGVLYVVVQDVDFVATNRRISTKNEQLACVTIS